MVRFIATLVVCTAFVVAVVTWLTVDQAGFMSYGWKVLGVVGIAVLVFGSWQRSKAAVE